MAWLINAAAILERADESLLPAVYKELSRDFGATPWQLGALTFIRAMVQALCSPLAAMLTLRHDRPSVIGIGTIFWAASTAAVGLSRNIYECALWRAVNGVGLAIVVPATQSFVADSYADGHRGVAFGLLSSVATFGGIAGSAAATVAAGQPSILRIPGWRFIFLAMAACSAVVGFLVQRFVHDSSKTRHGLPQQLVKNEKTRAMTDACKESVIAMRSIAGVPTFQLIVLQGIVGSLPWTAMVFFTLWFQLIGFGHAGAALLSAIFSTGTAVGALAGGWIGDAAERRFPSSGRIMCAQLSSFLGIPFSFALLHQLPQEPGSWLLFVFTLASMGLCISWNSACANNPMFAEVVPRQHRTMVYAFDRAIEGAFSAVAAPLVGLLAEKVYGFNTRQQQERQQARALSSSLFAVMAIPFGLCCLCYTPLYLTYRKDKRRSV